MDETWLIFIAGTIASLLPVYWLLSRTDRRGRVRGARRNRRGPSGQPQGGERAADRQASGEFVALLRREAACRFDRTLAEAVAAIERPVSVKAPASWLDASRRRRIEEAQMMLEPLFGADISERCAAHVRALLTATGDATDVARAARLEIRTLLASVDGEADAVAANVSGWAAA